MGRFLAIGLVLAAACGDNIDVDGIGSPPDDTVGPGELGTPTPRLVPQVCGAQSWTTNIAADPKMDVAVLPRQQGGATVLAVPYTGGTMTGFNLDARMNMIGEGAKVEIDNVFNGVSVSTVGDRLVAVSHNRDAVFVHMLDDDFANPQWIAKFPGSLISKPSLHEIQGDLVLPIATDDGLVLHRLYDSLEPRDTLLVKATEPAIAMDAVQLGVSTMAAWSTRGSCHLMMMPAFAAGPTTELSGACPSLRLAANAQSGEGLLAFAGHDGVRLVHFTPTHLGSESRLVRADATAPRVIFDGQRIWVSYLDVRGDVVIGFLDTDGKLVTTSLGGPQPFGAAYELVMMDGAPWVFALEADGYTAHRLCVGSRL
jgi:hypothetical protein